MSEPKPPRCVNLANIAPWRPLVTESGDVYFDRPRLCIMVRLQEGHESYYEIDLETITTAPNLLDWIFQINMKTWMTPQKMKGFLDIMEALCLEYFDNNLQGVFCPSGASRPPVKWKPRR